MDHLSLAFDISLSTCNFLNGYISSQFFYRSYTSIHFFFEKTLSMSGGGKDAGNA